MRTTKVERCVMLQECEKEQECAEYRLINQITSFLKVQLVLFVNVHLQSLVVLDIAENVLEQFYPCYQQEIISNEHKSVNVTALDFTF